MRACPFCAEEIQEAAVICRFCGRDVPPIESAPTRRISFDGKLARVVEVGLGLITFAAVAYLVMSQLAPRARNDASVVGDRATSIPPATPRPPLVLPLVDSSLVIYAGGHFDTSFIAEDDRPCKLTGRIDGVTGGDRDVEVYVMDEQAFADWHDGHASLSPTFASGRSSSTVLNVSVPSNRRTTLLISNRYSLLTDKRVSVKDVQVRCGE